MQHVWCHIIYNAINAIMRYNADFVLLVSVCSEWYKKWCQYNADGHWQLPDRGRINNMPYIHKHPMNAWQSELLIHNMLYIHKHRIDALQSELLIHTWCGGPKRGLHTILPWQSRYLCTEFESSSFVVPASQCYDSQHHKAWMLWNPGICPHKEGMSRAWSQGRSRNSTEF